MCKHEAIVSDWHHVLPGNSFWLLAHAGDHIAKHKHWLVGIHVVYKTLHPSTNKAEVYKVITRLPSTWAQCTIIKSPNNLCADKNFTGLTSLAVALVDRCENGNNRFEQCQSQNLVRELSDGDYDVQHH